MKEAAFAFLSYMTQPAQSNVDVTIGKTGFNPYRVSQFKSLDLWLKAGMSETAAKVYLGAIQDSLNSPNMALICASRRTSAMSRWCSIRPLPACSPASSRWTTMKAITDGWNEITDEIGRDDQLAAYKSTLGQ